MVELIEGVLILAGVIVAAPFVFGYLTSAYRTIFSTKVTQEALETQEGEKLDKSHHA